MAFLGLENTISQNNFLSTYDRLHHSEVTFYIFSLSPPTGKAGFTFFLIRTLSPEAIITTVIITNIDVFIVLLME
jgi:hypothetical protein